MTLDIRGVFCAAATPLTSDLEPDADLFLTHCRWLLEQGCDGIAMLGTTGEANSLSLHARKSLLDATLTAGIPATSLLPGTGTTSLADTVDLTRHAVASGVRAVVVLPPYYYKNVEPDGVTRYYSEFADRVGDDRLKVILYHIPQMSMTPIHHETIAALREKYPSTFVGIKDSSGDEANMETMVRLFPGLSVLTGADHLLGRLLAKGGAGCITATSNVAPSELALIYARSGQSLGKPDVAAAQERLVLLRRITQEAGQIAGIKSLLADINAKPSWRATMPPLSSLNGTVAASLYAASGLSRV